MNEIIIEKYVEKYGERYRKLFEDSLAWLDSTEKSWNLPGQINRQIFIDHLMERVAK